MLKYFFAILIAVSSYWAAAPVFAQSSIEGSFPGSDPVEQQNEDLEKSKNIFCEVTATNTLLSSSQNRIHAKIHYRSGGILRDLPYTIEAFGDEGRVFSMTGKIDIDSPDAYVRFDAVGNTVVDIPFNTDQNEEIAIQASIGKKGCVQKIVQKIEPASFGFELHQGINFNGGFEDIQADVDTQNQADQNGLIQNEEQNNQPQEANNFEVDIQVAPENFASPQIEEGDEAGEQPEEQNNQEAIQNAVCKVVSEARKDGAIFRIFGAISFNQFPQGEYQFALIAGMPDGSATQKRTGSVQVDAEGNGIILREDNSSFRFAFNRTQQEQEIVVNAQIADVICASTLFIDSGMSSSVSTNGNGSENQQNNNANLSGATGLTGEASEEVEAEEERVFPEGASQEDIRLLNQLQIVEKANSSSQKETDDMQEMSDAYEDDVDWGTIALLILGLIIIALLGANLIKKNRNNPAV